MNSATAIPPQSAIDSTLREEVALLRDVRQVLLATGYAELLQVWVEVHKGEVFLCGSVSTYYQKQVAQEAVKRVEGVEVLTNDITVIRQF